MILALITISVLISFFIVGMFIERYLLHKCQMCEKECCINLLEVDPAAGCQTDPVKKDDNDKPMSTCCGGGTKSE